jgi:hypothetical protein
MSQFSYEEQRTEIFAFDFKDTFDPQNSSFPSLKLIKKILAELKADEDRSRFIEFHNQYMHSQIHDVYPEEFESSQISDPSFEIKQKRFFNLRKQFKLANITEESGITFGDYWRTYHYIKWFLFVLGNSKGGDIQSLIKLQKKKLKASQTRTEIGKVKFKQPQYPELDRYDEYKQELVIFDGVHHYLDWFDLKQQITESILSSLEVTVDTDKNISFGLNIASKFVKSRLFILQLRTVIGVFNTYAVCIECIDKGKEIGFSYLQLQVAILKAVNLFLWFEPFQIFKELRLSYQELEIQLAELELTEKSEEKDRKDEIISATGFRCPFCHSFGLIQVGGKSFAHCGSEKCRKQYSIRTSQKNRESPSVLNQNPLQDFLKSLPKAFNGQRKRCECRYQRVLYEFEGKNSCQQCITEILSDRGFQ